MNAPVSQTPVLHVCPLGMDERAHQTLRLFFERQLGTSCVLSDEGQAHVVLIDIDNYKSKGLLDEQMRKHPERPMLLLSLNASDAVPPNAVLVKKPIKIDLFAAALQKLSEQIFQPKPETHFSAASETDLEARRARHREGVNAAPGHVDSSDVAAVQEQSHNSSFYIGVTPDVDLSNPEQRAKVFYDPQHFLQGHVQRAASLDIGKASMVRLSGAAFQRIDIYPASRQVVTTAPGSILFVAGRLPIQVGDVHVEIVDNTPPQPPANEKAEHLDALLWKLALWASRGRVPVGTDLEWPVFLKRWPNLTRLLEPPHATRIAGLWAHQHYSLADTATTLGIPQRFVFAFFSGCAALSLAAPTRRAADVLVEPEAPPAKDKRGLFRMLMRKLGRNWDN